MITLTLNIFKVVKMLFNHMAMRCDVIWCAMKCAMKYIDMLWCDAVM